MWELLPLCDSEQCFKRHPVADTSSTNVPGSQKKRQAPDTNKFPALSLILESHVARIRRVPALWMTELWPRKCDTNTFFTRTAPFHKHKQKIPVELAPLCKLLQCSEHFVVHKEMCLCTSRTNPQVQLLTIF